ILLHTSALTSSNAMRKFFARSAASSFNAEYSFRSKLISRSSLPPSSSSLCSHSPIAAKNSSNVVRLFRGRRNWRTASRVFCAFEKHTQIVRKLPIDETVGKIRTPPECPSEVAAQCREPLYQTRRRRLFHLKPSGPGG